MLHLLLDFTSQNWLIIAKRFDNHAVVKTFGKIFALAIYWFREIQLLLVPSHLSPPYGLGLISGCGYTWAHYVCTSCSGPDWPLACLELLVNKRKQPFFQSTAFGTACNKCLFFYTQLESANLNVTTCTLSLDCTTNDLRLIQVCSTLGIQKHCNIYVLLV